jgi:hypothetical protein
LTTALRDKLERLTPLTAPCVPRLSTWLSERGHAAAILGLAAPAQATADLNAPTVVSRVERCRDMERDEG